jgi:hypothetical protein
MPWKVYIIMSVRQGRGRVKGQLVFEFVISTLFFLAIVMYTINYLNTMVFLYSGDHHTNRLESKAWQISEVLARSQGSWSGSGQSMTPRAIGLAEGWPVLSEDKIASLGSWCPANMEAMMTLLDVDPQTRGVALEVNKSLGSGGESNLLVCGRVPGGIQNARATRFGVSDADLEMLRVSVWYW